MLKRIFNCFSLTRSGPKLATLALSSLALGIVPVSLNAQEDLVVDDYASGWVGQSIHDSTDRYYSSPVPQWFYSTAHADGASGGEIAEDSSGNKYLKFTGAAHTWSMTLYDRDAGILNLSPAQPFQIDFDLLNTAGEEEASALLFHYLLNNRWTNFGAASSTDPVGYRLQIRIDSDTTVRYEIIAKGGGQYVTIPGTQGTATVAPGLFGSDGNPGRPVQVSLEIFQNQQKLSIDGVEMFDVDINPLPQNDLFGNTGLVQIWSSSGTARGMDNLLIRQFPVPEPEPWQPVVAGDLYWANTTMIRTAESDGADSRIVRDGFTRAIGVAIDDLNGKVYWTDGIQVFRSDLTGENQEAIYSGSGSMQGIAVNPGAGKVYWTENYSGLYMADLDGSNNQQVTDIADYGVTGGSAGVTVDPTTGEVYWALTTNGALVRMQADGTGIETIATLPNNVYGLAVDADRQRVYYSIYANPGTLNYLDLTTGESTTVFDDLGQPLGVALTADGAGLFWAERINGKIKRAYITEDGTIGGVETIRLGEVSPFYIAVTADATGPAIPEPPPVFEGFVNGDFERETFDDGWSVNIGGKALPHAGIAPGSTTAAFINNDGSTRLIQYLPQWAPLIATTAPTEPSVVVVTDPSTGEHRSEFLRGVGPKWQFGLHVAGGDPDGAGNRSLNLLLGHVQAEDDNGTNVPTINFRLNGAGGADVYNSGSPKGWQVVFPAGTFESSVVVDDQFVDPNVYYIEFNGDYSTEDPTYTVAIARAGESEFLAVSQPMRSWQNGVPPVGSGIAMVQFHGYVNAPYVVDDMHLVEVVESEGYATWAAQHFSPAELSDPAISGPEVDDDGDGIANLLEYALGGNPRLASVTPLPMNGLVDVDGELYLTLTYTRPVDSDAGYHVEASADLSQWETGPVETASVDNGDATLTVTYRDTQSIGATGSRFLRLRVSGK